MTPRGRGRRGIGREDLSDRVVSFLRLALVAATASLIPLSGNAIAGEDLRIGSIDFYGLRLVTAERLHEVLGLNEGDAPPEDRAELEKRLEGVPGVARAKLQVVCCDEGAAILFVGIEERGKAGLHFRSPSRSAIRLPEEVVETYDGFMEALVEAVRKGETGEDHAQGHALASDPACRAYQERAIEYVRSQRELLRKVLKQSEDPEHRALAAWVLGYAADKREVTGDLLEATRDPDSVVRNNATRALWCIAEFAARRPELRIRIPPGHFIDMLGSIDWTDRNKAVMVLGSLAEGGDPALLRRLRRRAGPTLAEMARWKSSGHALGAYFLLGRMAGLSGPEIRESWSKGERETVIAKALAGTNLRGCR